VQKPSPSPSPAPAPGTSLTPHQEYRAALGAARGDSHFAPLAEAARAMGKTRHACGAATPLESLALSLFALMSAIVIKVFRIRMLHLQGESGRADAITSIVRALVAGTAAAVEDAGELRRQPTSSASTGEASAAPGSARPRPLAPRPGVVSNVEIALVSVQPCEAAGRAARAIDRAAREHGAELSSGTWERVIRNLDKTLARDVRA